MYYYKNHLQVLRYGMGTPKVLGVSRAGNSLWDKGGENYLNLEGKCYEER